MSAMAMAAYYQANRKRIDARRNERLAVQRQDPERAAVIRGQARARFKAWRARNRRVVQSMQNANHRAMLRGVGGRLTVADVRGVLSVGLCALCGATENLTLDHIRPLGRGGPNVRTNLQCLCGLCNSRKGVR